MPAWIVKRQTAGVQRPFQSQNREGHVARANIARETKRIILPADAKGLFSSIDKVDRRVGNPNQLFGAWDEAAYATVVVTRNNSYAISSDAFSPIA